MKTRTYPEAFWKFYDARPTWAAEAYPHEWYEHWLRSGKALPKAKGAA